jgi:hypothetical protein
MELINNKLDMMWKEASWSNVFDGGDEESHESISQNRSQGSPKYKAGMLPTRPHEVVWQ